MNKYRLLQSNDDQGIYEAPGSTPAAPVTPVAPIPAAPEPVQTQTTTEPVQTTQTTTAPTPPPVTRVELSPEAIREIRGVQPQPQQPQWTPQQQQVYFEQLRKDSHYFEVSKERLQKLGVAEPTDEQVVQYQQLVADTARHGFGQAKLYADALAQQQFAQYQQQLAPVLQYVQTAQQEALKNEFYGQYDALKQFPNVVDAAAKTINPNDANGRPRPKDSIFKEVADKALDVLRNARGDPNLTFESFAPQGTNTNQAPASHSAVPRPNQMTGTGRSAGGNSSNQAPSEFDIYKETYR